MAEIFGFDIEANVCNDNDCVLRGVSILIYSICRAKKKGQLLREVNVLCAQDGKNILDGVKRAIRKLNLLRSMSGTIYL